MRIIATYFTLLRQPFYHFSFCGNLLASPTLDVHPYYLWVKQLSQPQDFQAGWTIQVSQASQCLFKHPALVGSLDKWALWNFAKVLWQLYSSQDTASWSVTVAPWSPGLRVAVTATAWSWELSTGGMTPDTTWGDTAVMLEWTVFDLFISIYG